MKPLHILLADTNPDTRSQLNQVITFSGLEALVVHPVGSIEEAKEILQKHAIDLLVLGGAGDFHEICTLAGKVPVLTTAGDGSRLAPALLNIHQVVQQKIRSSVQHQTVLEVTSKHAALLLQSGSWRAVVEDLLRDLLPATRADSIFIESYEAGLGGKLTSKIICQVTAGTEWEYQPDDQLPLWYDTIAAGEVFLTQVEDLPKRLRGPLSNQTGCQLQIIPIFASAALWGCLGLHYSLEQDARPGQLLDSLRKCANIIGSAVEHEINQDEYRLLAESSIQAIVITTTSGIMYANPVAEEITGYSLQELKCFGERQVIHLIHPEDRRLALRIFRDLFRSPKETTPAHFRIMHKNGQIRWVETMSSRMTVRGQPTLQICGFDITNLKTTQQRLHARVELNTLINEISTRFINTPLNLIDRTIRLALRSLCAYMKISHSFLLLIGEDGQPVHFYEWVEPPFQRPHQKFEPLVNSAHAQALLQITRHEMVRLDHLSDLPPEFTGIRAIWETMGIQSLLCMPMLLNQNLLGYIGFYTQTDPIQWTEEKTSSILLIADVFAQVIGRKKAEENAQAGEERYRLLAEAMLDIVGLHNANGDFVYVTPSIEKITGWSASESIGRSTMERIHPGDAATVAQEINLAHSKRGDTIVQWRCLCKNGLYRWLETHLHAVEPEPGKGIFWISSTRDIHERKQTEEALKAANQRLQKTVLVLKQTNHESNRFILMGSMLQSCLKAEEIYQVLAMFCNEFFPNVSGTLYLVNTEQNFLEMVTTWGDSPASESVFLVNDCWGLRRNRLHMVIDPEQDLICRHIKMEQPYPYICAPLVAQGETLGSLHLRRVSSDSLERVQQLTAMLAERVALALMNLRLQESLHTQSIHDALTGLYNRRYMEDAIENELRRAAQNNYQVAAIMIDADNFKNINDRYGHEAGDVVLQQLASFLRVSLRSNDVAVRYGGDEFLLLLSEITFEDALRRANDLVSGSRGLVVHHRGQVLEGTQLSIGLALYPDHAYDVENLLRAADKALYRAKQNGRNCVFVSDPSQG